MARSLLLLLCVMSVGCVTPGSGAESPSRRSGHTSRGDQVRRGLEERAARPQSLLTFAESVRGDVDDPRLEAELELAVARAQREVGRPLSAKLSLQRAWSHVQPSAQGLGAEILLEWADLEHRTGQRTSARSRWEDLLRRPGLSASARDRALAALVASHEMSGDDALARSWRRKLGSGHTTLVVSARKRLQPMTTQRAVASAPRPGPIPSDPRELLPEIHTRSSWGARALGPDHRDMEPIQAITVHHTAMTRPRPGQGGSAMRSIQAFHQDDRAWADIGYHFLIDPEGGIWEGRSLQVQGAHAGSDKNRGNVGVCLMGNFEDTSVPSAQRQSLERLLDTLRGRFSLSHADVFPHSRFKETACPGRSLSQIVDDYRGA